MYTVPQGTEIEVFRKVLEAHCHFVFLEQIPCHVIPSCYEIACLYVTLIHLDISRNAT